LRFRDRLIVPQGTNHRTTTQIFLSLESSNIGQKKTWTTQPELSFCCRRLTAQKEFDMIAASRQALYIPMRDGIRIAIDVFLPEHEANAKLPTSLSMTRYQRSSITQRTDPENDGSLAKAERWNAHGYVLVVVDARGSGASFGSRSGELSQTELEDYFEVMTWIAVQPWSNGRIGAQGVSYGGDTAELIASLGHPALTATAPLFTDFDSYEDTVFPGGVYNATFGLQWFMMNNALDGIEGAAQTVKDANGLGDQEYLEQFPGANPVDGPDGERLLELAIQDHQANANGTEYLSRIECKDDGQDDARFDAMPYARRAQIEAANVPFLVLAGWQDAGTPSGTFSRLSAFKNHQEVYIGAWSHGGGFNTDPFAASIEEPDFSSEKQFELLTDFFDRFVKGSEQPQPGLKKLSYYTMAEAIWHRSEGIPKTQPQRLYFAEHHSLEQTAPTNSSGSDQYNVNFNLGTGETARWRTQLDGSVVAYPNQREEDHHRWVYTSAPLEQDLRVTGFPRLNLALRSSTPDGTVIAYLEDVAPDGEVRMISEGLLRLAHRKLAGINPDGRALRTPRTYARADMQAMPIDEVQTLAFDFVPVSMLFQKGHRIRVAIVGHDKDQFQPYAEQGQVYTLERNSGHVSYLELPVE
jgi:uncharacterized protein